MKNEIELIQEVITDLTVHIEHALGVLDKTKNHLIKDHIEKMEDQLRILEGEVNYLRRVKGA